MNSILRNVRPSIVSRTTPVVKRPTSAASFFTLNPGSSVQGLPPRTRNQGYASIARPERALRPRRRPPPHDEVLRPGATHLDRIGRTLG